MKRRPSHQGFARPQFRERLPNGGPDCTRPDKHHHRSRTAAQEMGKLLVKVAVGGFLIGAATVALAVSR